MKPTQIIDLLANIKDTIVSFISILMFVALGVAVFLGISWAKPALQNGAENMFDEGTFHSFQIQYPYGLTEGDLQRLSATEGVSQIEAERQSFQTLRKNSSEYTVKVQSLGKSIDVPITVEGKLPTSPDEIAFHAESARQLGVSVGDTITFEADAEEDDNATAGKKDTNTSGMKYLLSRAFTVTAIVNSADYVAYASATYGFSTSPSGTVDALAWVTDDAFDAAAYQDGYPIVNVRCDSLADIKTFEDDYKQASNDIQSPIETLGSTLATARYDSLHEQAQKQIDEGQAKIDEGQAKIDESEAKISQGEKDIADGEKKLEDGRAELERKRAEGQAELNSAYAKLMDGESQKADGERRLNEARAEVNDARQKINEADECIAIVRAEVDDANAYKTTCDEELAAGRISKEEYNQRLDARGAQADALIQPIAQQYGRNVPSINHETYGIALDVLYAALAESESLPVTVDGEEITLGEARQRLATAEDELEAAQAEYDQAVSELNAGWSKYYDGQETFKREVAQAEQDIADGEAKLEDAKRQVEDGKKQVADGKKQIEENKPVLEKAKARLAEMIKYNWTVLPRAYNAGYGEVSTFSGVTESLSISMAALFIVVGLLVSYFAVSRIVHEQVTQIGTKKALGLRQGEITASFLWYSGLAVVAGAIVGALLAFYLVEAIINGVLGGMFAFGPYPAYFGWGLFLAILVIELVLVLGATYLACRKILKQHAVELLRGETTPAGKPHFYEKWGIWHKLPLLIQVIVNNCVNDKRRALSTIVGVAGCTALIVTAITLNDDVMKSYDRHYENVFGFNAIAYAESESEGATDAIASAIERQGFPVAQAFEKSYLLVLPNGESSAMHIIVPTNDAFDQLYHVRPVTDNEYDPSEEGAWVSQAYADHFGAKVGDTITIDGGDGMKHQVPILGFYEFWLSYNEMVVNKAYFEKEFGAVTPNVVLCQTAETPVANVKQSLSSIEGFHSIVDDAAIQYSNFDTFSAVSNAVVIIYLVLAVLMAIVVLLNLNVMFIAEKKRELIVLMINGFSVKDARHYISYDTIVLTALGIIVGILLGIIMGSITVASIEPSTGVFLKSADGLAIVIGILGSAILALIMSLISLRRINKFDLTDINRF